MKEFGRRALALVLAVLLLGLCACSAKTEMVQEETAASEAAAEPAQDAVKPEEAPVAEKPSKEEEPDAAIEEKKPETVEPEENEETAQEPEVRAPIDELPEQEAPAVTDAPLTCTISISCATILNNMSDLKSGKEEFVPSDGWILAASEVEFTEGESVHDVLQRVCKDAGIQMESSFTPAYNSAYVEGINNLYEFDCGQLSGWMYNVNGWFPNYGCSKYTVQDGDVINWVYTCNLGKDVGDNSMY